jgi:TctA family transporter
MVLGLIAAVVLAHGSLLKAIAMVLVGLLLGLVGIDVNSGIARFSYGVPELSDGIGFVTIAMGMFGIADIMLADFGRQSRDLLASRIEGVLPTRADLKRSTGAILRGTALGSLLGILPGGGAILSSFAAYSLEKSIGDTSRFGKGEIRGVAAPEAANNAGAQTSFIPLLTLGLPSHPVMALMMGAMMIQGIQPGPQVMKERPELFWGMVASMWVGNLLLIVLNLPLIGIWVKVLAVPYRLLYPAILLFCGIGVFTVNNSPFDIHLMVLFAVFGVVCVKLDCEPAPLILGFILGPLLEENLRRAMVYAGGDLTVFFTRPISLGLLLAAAALLVAVVAPAVRKRRQEAFEEA